MEKEVYQFVIFDSLLLIKLERAIEFRQSMHYIYLPDADQLKIWKNHFLLPNNTRYTTSYWYRNRVSVINYIFSLQKQT